MADEFAKYLFKTKLPTSYGGFPRSNFAQLGEKVATGENESKSVVSKMYLSQPILPNLFAIRNLYLRCYGLLIDRLICVELR
jgi:hypothetical protein